MTETGSASDMGIGLSMLFGAFGVLGAAVMYLAADQQTIAAGGFALAIVAGAIAIGALHVYDN